MYTTIGDFFSVVSTSVPSMRVPQGLTGKPSPLQCRGMQSILSMYAARPSAPVLCVQRAPNALHSQPHPSSLHILFFVWCKVPQCVLLPCDYSLMAGCSFISPCPKVVR